MSFHPANARSGPWASRKGIWGTPSKRRWRTFLTRRRVPLPPLGLQSGALPQGREALLVRTRAVVGKRGFSVSFAQRDHRANDDTATLRFLNASRHLWKYSRFPNSGIFFAASVLFGCALQPPGLLQRPSVKGARVLWTDRDGLQVRSPRGNSSVQGPGAAAS